ncbi:hypothetical protein B2J93_2280 [Marssonina coronariae]|uniref:BAH domain-containing protein n=1 Tax=Diplocarpon coronariae TaxID=2795749 RepID=A0A218YUA7_9HELO|nr:hypothetical protein B2J93_2280 [Marssonina coronariae]
MAPKHDLAGSPTDEGLAEWARGSAKPASWSATPADTGLMMPFKAEYLDAVTTRKPTSKEREIAHTAKWHVSPYSVKVQGEFYRNNQLVFVRGPDTPKDRDTEGRPKDFWVARVLQVRAKNAQHVYALVAWMYWPEEIAPPAQRAADQVNKASGKRTYHGKREMVASNYMEVLDVLTFAGKAEVPQWDEEYEQPLPTL